MNQKRNKGVRKQASLGATEARLIPSRSRLLQRWRARDVGNVRPAKCLTKKDATARVVQRKRTAVSPSMSSRFCDSPRLRSLRRPRHFAPRIHPTRPHPRAPACPLLRNHHLLGVQNVMRTATNYPTNPRASPGKRRLESRTRFAGSRGRGNPSEPFRVLHGIPRPRNAGDASAEKPRRVTRRVPRRGA